MIRETQQLFTELGVEIEPEEKVENLKTSQKQLLEISKALFFRQIADRMSQLPH